MHSLRSKCEYCPGRSIRDFSRHAQTKEEKIMLHPGQWLFNFVLCQITRGNNEIKQSHTHSLPLSPLLTMDVCLHMYARAEMICMREQVKIDAFSQE